MDRLKYSGVRIIWDACAFENVLSTLVKLFWRNEEIFAFSLGLSMKIMQP